MNFKVKGYLKETRRPIYSAALVLPFLCVYHVGTILLHTTYINGADALIIRILSSLSVHSMFGSALVLAAAFTIWQLKTRASWKIKSGILLFSFLESLCFALDPAVCLRLDDDTPQPGRRRIRTSAISNTGPLLRSRRL